MCHRLTWNEYHETNKRAFNTLGRRDILLYERALNNNFCFVLFTSPNAISSDLRSSRRSHSTPMASIEVLVQSSPCSASRLSEKYEETEGGPPPSESLSQSQRSRPQPPRPKSPNVSATPNSIQTLAKTRLKRRRPALEALKGYSVKDCVIGPNHIAFLLEDGRICRIRYAVTSVEKSETNSATNSGETKTKT